METGSKQQNQLSIPIDPQFNQSHDPIIPKSRNSLKSNVQPDRMLEIQERKRVRPKLIKLTHEEFVGFRSLFEDIICQLDQ
jgi:hypothetical protein